MDGQRKRTPILFLPFILIWSLFSFFIKLTGRVIAAVLGIGFFAIGLVLSLTFVAAPIGIPLIFFGILMMVRSIF